MSSASKSKSKDKIFSKEAQKSLAKPSRSDVGMLASADNPLSNNGTSSDESKNNKRKGTNPPLARQKEVVVAEAVNDKQEKIRQKNERKHQLRKERQAQELHDLCSAYLISRKLEALAQQLVAMGFSHERAIMALILNEGNVEESVAWLFEGGEGEGEEEGRHMDKKKLNEGDLKIDIEEELARLVELETKYNCSKQEVERRVVACEGDLDKVVEALQGLKLNPPIAPPKPVKNADPPSITLPEKVSKNSGVQAKQAKPLPTPNQPKKDFKGATAKTTVMAGRPFESTRRNMLPLPVNAKFLPGPTMMSSYLPRINTSWYPITQCVDVMRPNNFLPHSNQVLQYLPQPPFWVGNNHNPPLDLQATKQGNNILWNKTSSASPILEASSSSSIGLSSIAASSSSSSSIGLSSIATSSSSSSSIGLSSIATSSSSSSSIGLSSIATSSSSSSSIGLSSIATSSSDEPSPIFWSSDGSMHYDYTNIDWSWDRGILSPKGSHGLCLGVSPFTKCKAQFYNSHASAMAASQPSMKSSSLPSDGSIVPLPGLPDGGVSST